MPPTMNWRVLQTLRNAKFSIERPAFIASSKLLVSKFAIEQNIDAKAYLETAAPDA